MTPTDEDSPRQREPVDPEDDTLRVSPPAPALEGETADMPANLGDFELGPLLGKGAMGRVHRAVHLKTGATVVLKMVSTSSRRAYLEALQAEVASLAELSVPHIPRIIDQGSEGGYAWFAQEFIDGVDLRAVISRRRDGDSSFHVDFAEDSSHADGRPATPPVGLGAEVDDMPRVMEWMRDLAFALDAVHRIGILHRDIKPANIMLADGRVPYLIDFGLAVHGADEHLIVGQPAGTLPYMSPEQASLGWTGLQPASDVYGLAVTFHELLTGERVVKSRAREAIVEEILHVPVPGPSQVRSHLPRSLDRIFLKATAKRVEDRYPSAAELARDIDHWLRPGDISQKIRRWYLDHRGPATAGGAALILAVLLLIGLVDPPPDPRHDVVVRLRTMVDDAAAAASAITDLPTIVDRYPDDDEIAGLARAIIAAGAARRSRFMVSEYGLQLRGKNEDALTEVIARDALALIDRGRDHPALRFQAGFAALVRGDREEADLQIAKGMELRHDPQLKRPLVALDLAAALASGSEERAAAARAALDAPVAQGHGRAERSFETCLQAIGHLLAADARRNSARARALLTALESERADDLRAVMQGLHARICIMLGEFDTAISDLRALSADPAIEDSAIRAQRRAGASSFLIVALVLRATEAAEAADQEGRARALEEAGDVADALYYERPGALGGFGRFMRQRLRDSGLMKGQDLPSALRDVLDRFLGGLSARVWARVESEEQVLWLLQKVVIHAETGADLALLRRFDGVLSRPPAAADQQEIWINYRERLPTIALTAVYRSRDTDRLAATMKVARAFGERHTRPGGAQYRASALFQAYDDLLQIIAATRSDCEPADRDAARRLLIELEARLKTAPRREIGTDLWIKSLKEEIG